MFVVSDVEVIQFFISLLVVQIPGFYALFGLCERGKLIGRSVGIEDSLGGDFLIYVE